MVSVHYDPKPIPEICDAMENLDSVTVVIELEDNEDVTLEEKESGAPLSILRTQVVNSFRGDHYYSGAFLARLLRDRKKTFVVKTGRLFRN